MDEKTNELRRSGRRESFAPLELGDIENTQPDPGGVFKPGAEQQKTFRW